MCNQKVGKKKFIPSFRECILVQWLWETGWQFLIKLKTLSYDPAIPLLAIYLKELKSLYLHFYICCSIIHSNQNKESTQMPLTECLETDNVVHLQDGTILNNNKNKILPFIATWVNLRIIMVCWTIQMQKDKPCYNHLYIYTFIKHSEMWNWIMETTFRAEWGGEEEDIKKKFQGVGIVMGKEGSESECP